MELGGTTGALYGSPVASAGMVLGGNGGALYGQPVISGIALPLAPQVPTLAPETAKQVEKLLTKLVKELEAYIAARRGASLAGSTSSAGTQGGGGGGGGGTGGASRAKVATFNILGSSHTASGGKKASWDSGVQRMPEMVAALRKHSVDIVGLQEMQSDQQAAFRKAAPGYDMFGDKDNVIAWKKDRYTKVDQKTLTIPYFEGTPRKMPAVLLQDRQTGKQVWVLNVHNPANTADHPDNAAHRAEAVKRERAFVQQLRATGVPVMVTGDFNDDKVATDAMTRGVLTTVADPAGSARNIDWVFGSGVKFGATTRDTTPKEQQASDHPIVVTDATF